MERNQFGITSKTCGTRNTSINVSVRCTIEITSKGGWFWTFRLSDNGGEKTAGTSKTPPFNGTSIVMAYVYIINVGVA